MRTVPFFKKILPNHTLPAHLFKDDQEAISLFKKEWNLQKYWLLTTGWSLMTVLLIPLGVLLDTGIINLAGRSGSLSFSLYFMLLVLSVTLALASVFMKNMINIRFKTPPTQKQVEWVAGKLKIKVAEMPKGLSLGTLSDTLKEI